MHGVRAAGITCRLRAHAAPRLPRQGRRMGPGRAWACAPACENGGQWQPRGRGGHRSPPPTPRSPRGSAGRLRGECAASQRRCPLHRPPPPVPCRPPCTPRPFPCRPPCARLPARSPNLRSPRPLAISLMLFSCCHHFQSGSYFYGYHAAVLLLILQLPLLLPLLRIMALLQATAILLHATATATAAGGFRGAVLNGNLCLQLQLQVAAAEPGFRAEVQVRPPLRTAPAEPGAAAQALPGRLADRPAAGGALADRRRCCSSHGRSFQVCRPARVVARGSSGGRACSSAKWGGGASLQCRRWMLGGWTPGAEAAAEPAAPPVAMSGGAEPPSTAAGSRAGGAEPPSTAAGSRAGCQGCERGQQRRPSLPLHPAAP